MLLYRIPYHPQRFNKTLKSMLRKAAISKGTRWSPIYSLHIGRSNSHPQDFPYGRTVRGPLDVHKETWEDTSESIVRWRSWWPRMPNSDGMTRIEVGEQAELIVAYLPDSWGEQAWIPNDSPVHHKQTLVVRKSPQCRLHPWAWRPSDPGKSPSVHRRPHRVLLLSRAFLHLSWLSLNSLVSF